MTAKKKISGQSPDNTLHIYTRVSTVTQADKGTSLESQLQLGTKKAKELKFGIKHWDEGGRSSHHDDIQGRPKLYELVESIKAGQVKHLWVYDQSRLSRKDHVASILRYEFQKQGVTLYTKDGYFDFSSAEDSLLKKLLDAIAEFENSMRAERSRIGKIMKVKGGYWHGGPPPYGYLLSAGKLELNKNESKWVKFIFKQTYKGRSVSQIKKEMDSQGVLARRGGLFTLGSIESLMTNTHYIGRYNYKDGVSGEEIEVKCPPIIDELMWNAISLARKRNQSRKDQINATKRNFYLLRDFMFCGHCGRKLAGRIKLSKAEQMYYCPNKERAWAQEGKSTSHYKRGTGCGFDRSMNIQLTDDVVFNTVVELHKKSSLLKEEVKRRVYAEQGIKNISTAEQTKKFEAQLRKYQARHKSHQEAIGNLEANRFLKNMDDLAYKTAISRMNDEADRIKSEINNIRLKLKGETNKKQWVDWVETFGKEVDDKKKLTKEERQTYLSGLIDRIEARFDRESRSHQLDIHFHHPIVGDGIKWRNPKKKSLGYDLIEGSKKTEIIVEKRDGRGR